MKKHAHNTSNRTHDYENFQPTYGQTSCSYVAREASIDQSRDCNRQFEKHNTDREIYDMSPAAQLGTDKGNRCETVYLTVRRRQPSEKSPVRSSVQGVSRDGDFRQENVNVDWEKCTIFSGESNSCLAPESKDEGDEQSVDGRKWTQKEEGNQVIDENTLKQLSNTRSSLREEQPSPLSSMADKKFVSRVVGGSISGSEIDLREVTTQQKRRILINTSNNKPSPELHSRSASYSHASPERCRASNTECKSGLQYYQSPGTHSSGLPRSTFSRNLTADGSSSYWSPSRATPVDAQTVGQRKPCDDSMNDEFCSSSLRKSEVNDANYYKLASAQTEQGSQWPLQLGAEYEQASCTFDSRDSEFMQRLAKIDGGMHTNLNERPAMSLRPLELAEHPLPANVNFELMRKVEELERQIADEKKKFQVVAERLAEQKIEADKNAQQMQDDWDGKIRELQKEKYALSIRLQSTETAHLASLLAGQGPVQAQPIQSAIQSAQIVTQLENGSASQLRLSSHRHHEEFLKELEADEARNKVDMVNALRVTDQEAIKIKQEVLQQEVLIRGYQHENEKAMETIKRIQAEANEATRIMAEENAKLASQVNHYQRCGMSSGPLEATELALQEALDREAHMKKLEVQLKKEIARLKDELFKAHTELERRQKWVSKTLDDLESEIERLKNSLTEERESHARTCYSKDNLMNSLAENQKVLSSQQSTIEQQAVQIAELENRVANYDEEAANRNIKGRRPEFDHKCVKNGLTALTQSTKDESDKVRKLQLEHASLRKQYNQKQDENSKSMNMLKLELESSKQEYEKRLQHLQRTRPDMEPEVANEQLAQKRVRALETQVVNIRIHYARKLKELTDKLAESKNEQTKLKLAAEIAAQYKKIPPTRTIKVKELMDAKERIGTLEDALELKEHTIRSLQHKLEQFQAEDRGDDPSGSSSISVKQSASLSKIKFKIQENLPQRGRPIHLGDRIHDSEELLQSNGTILLHGRRDKDDIEEQKIKELKRLNSLPPTLPEKRDDSPHESEPHIVNLRKRLERTEGSVEALQQQCNEAMQNATLCSIQHQQLSHEHLQQASQTNTEDQSMPTSLSLDSQQGCLLEPKTRDSAVCANINSTSGAVDWRSYNDNLERGNRSLQAKCPDIFAGSDLEVWSSGSVRLETCPLLSHEQEHERSGRACMAGTTGFLRRWERLKSKSGSQCRCNPLPVVIATRTILHRRNVGKTFTERKISLPKRIEGRAIGGGNLAKHIQSTSIRIKGSKRQNKRSNDPGPACFSADGHHNDENDKPEALCSSRSPPSSWSPPLSSSPI